MVERPGDTMSGGQAPRGGLSLIAALLAAAVAVVLAFLFYGFVGFPTNIPLAFGAAVLMAETVELILERGTFQRRGLARAFVHGIVVAGACWVGVWVAELLKWTG